MFGLTPEQQAEFGVGGGTERTVDNGPKFGYCPLVPGDDFNCARARDWAAPVLETVEAGQ